jgi:hypothetical protein
MHRAAAWKEKDRQTGADQYDANGHDHERRLPARLGDVVGAYAASFSARSLTSRSVSMGVEQPPMRPTRASPRSHSD